MEFTDFFTLNPDMYIATVAILSLFVGSFLNVVIYRLPKMLEHSWSEECRHYLGLKARPHDNEKLNLFLPFSHCPHCKTPIKPWHNIPIVSYLVLGGKCAYCNVKVSARYLFVELLTCVCSTYVAWKFGISWQAFGGVFFTWTIICLTFIDIDHHLLPDNLTLLLLWGGLFFSLFSLFCNTQDAIIGAITGYLIFAITQWSFGAFTGKTGMGQGDFKFLAAIGAFLGWQMLPLTILLASFTGAFFGITQMVIRRQFKSIPLPFGPYLALGGWVSLTWGQEIVQFYTQTFFL